MLSSFARTPYAIADFQPNETIIKAAVIEISTIDLYSGVRPLTKRIPIKDALESFYVLKLSTKHLLVVRSALLNYSYTPIRPTQLRVAQIFDSSVLLRL